MTTDRIKEIQAETAYPDSTSVQQALLKVWNECQQKHFKGKKMAVKNLTIQRVGSALRPTQINHGDVWGHGKDWFTFYCPNTDCERQLSGETECPHCGQNVVWKSTT